MNSLRLACLALGLTLAGCTAAPREVDLMPQTLIDGVPYEPLEESIPPDRSAQFEEVPPAEPAPQVETEEGADEVAGALAHRLVTVIRSAADPDPVGPIALAAAVRAERERRAATRPIEVITNQNLAESAKGGQVTIASTPPPSAAEIAAAVQADENSLKEEYWRSSALQMRLDWKAAVEDVSRLKEEVASLRRDFYDEDDPFYRDHEIKPAWDRALEELAAAEERSEDSAANLDLFLDEGRRAGALPGWLREGRDYEPVLERSPVQRRRDDPREPKIVDEEYDP